LFASTLYLLALEERRQLSSRFGKRFFQKAKRITRAHPLPPRLREKLRSSSDFRRRFFEKRFFLKQFPGNKFQKKQKYFVFLLDRIHKLARITACLFYKATKRQSDKATKRQSDKATKRQSVKSKNKSFTLLEIIFTIVIIGILLAIFLPVMSSIKLAAQKVKDQSNLKTIAAAWRECAINRGWVIDGKDKDDSNTAKATVFVQQMAGRFQENKISNIVLNDPCVYVSPGDKYASQVREENVCKIVNTNITWIDSWRPIQNFMVSSSDYFFSYCFIMGVPAYASLDTTPLGFTRGLRVDGKWDEKAGLYASKGGYVVYCDGHTVWFDGNKPTRFLKWDQSGYTSDIREAVPSSAFITCGNNRTKTDYTSDGKLVILRHAGTGDD
jgi:Tfp pilus assembly protein PilE